MPLLVGTSGWQYRDWRGTFYPADMAQARWLEHYAERFRTVEVNNAFYRLPEASTFQRWAERTPSDFVVGVKTSRYLTHVRRLREPEEAVARFVDRARHLGPKLGPVLVQLPPNLRLDADALECTLGCFPPEWRVAVEFRHDSWFVDPVYALLSRFDAALCLADSPRRSTPVRRTASWGYVRLHEGGGPPHPCYDEAALDTWAGTLARLYAPDDDVYAYFNNDPRGCAVRDATVFAGAAARHRLQPTRTPATGDVHVAA
ncbi:MAG: DUF72 domain-containing protein [Actinomycetota bacterium]|nr:DUF72 domain-containing protein [Actinomycetota bacterium]